MARKLHILCIAAALMVPGTAFAGGFYIQEQSVSGLGTAFAGAAADTPDASTIYYNPAGMTDLGSAEISTGVHYISPRSSFDNQGSTASSQPGTGGGNVALSGDDGSDPFPSAAVPNFYAAAPVNDDGSLWAGIGVSSPFGLGNEYDDDFTGRYDSTENEMITINAAPSIAWAPDERISVGAGVDVQYVDATLKSALPSPITAGGPVPATDGSTDLSGDALSVGFNVGAILKPDAATRIGVHYRHGIDHKLEGQLKTRVPTDIPAVGGNLLTENISATLNLPSIASFAVSRQVTPKLKILGGINWYRWSSFEDIPVERADGSVDHTPQNYSNTWGFAAGARYRVRENLELKTGAQYDQTPTADGFRSTRVPDGDRTWVSAGATYDINDKWVFDLSGTYVDVSEEDINLTNTVDYGGGATATYNLNGKIEGDVSIVSAALRYKFGRKYKKAR